MNEELLAYLKNPETWKRFAYMFLFLVIFYVVAHVVVLIVLFQAVLTLITGERNQRASDFSGQLIDYIHHILGYVSYRRDDAPYPFAEWSDTGGEPPAETAAAGDAPPAKKSGD